MKEKPDVDYTSLENELSDTDDNKDYEESLGDKGSDSVEEGSIKGADSDLSYRRGRHMCRDPFTDGEEEEARRKRALNILREILNKSYNGPCESLKWIPDDQDLEDLRVLY